MLAETQKRKSKAIVKNEDMLIRSEKTPKRGKNVNEDDLIQNHIGLTKLPSRDKRDLSLTERSDYN